jgi:hypothetical protein
VEILVQQAKRCENVNPELLNVFLEFKRELFFNRQLRINRTNSDFNTCFSKVSELLSASFLGIWSDALGLDKESNSSKLLLGLMAENFYLRITEETLTLKWLVDYMKELQEMTNNFKKDVIHSSIER